jgi:hypothetical protein
MHKIKIAVAIVVGLLASVGAAGAMSMISGTKVSTSNPVFAQQTGTSADEVAGQCKVTDDCLTINDDPNYCWTGHARGRMEACQQSVATEEEKPFVTCYTINGRRYCK